MRPDLGFTAMRMASFGVLMFALSGVGCGGSVQQSPGGGTGKDASAGDDAASQDAGLDGSGGAPGEDQYACFTAGGECNCYGSCPAGLVAATGPLGSESACPQGPPGSGACTMGCCVVDRDAAADAPSADASPTDALVDSPVDGDTISAFVANLEGVWLVGWSGGMNHFSWARFRSAQPGAWTGTVDILAGDDLAVNAPFWTCSGQGQWMIPAKPNSVLMTFPASCPAGSQAEYTFETFYAPGAYPDGAVLAATISELSGGNLLEGYKFPDSQCDAAMTSCIDPLY